MTNVREGWLWQFDRWVIEKEKEIIGDVSDSFLRNLGNGIKNIGIDIWNWFVPTIPDLIGYGAVATGVLVIISTMAGRGVVKPIGLFGGITVLAICVLEAN